MRKLPRVAGSPNYAVTQVNVARATPYEVLVAGEPPAEERAEPNGSQRALAGTTGSLRGRTWATRGPT